MKRTGFARKSLPERIAPVYSRLTVPIHRARISADAIACPKEPDGHNAHLLAMAKGMPCLLLSPICNHDRETTVACHGAGIENGKGMGRKVNDALSVHGCSACNDYTDAFYRATKAEKKAVFDAGLVRQIELWIVIAADPKAGHKDRKAASWALNHIFMR
jgi:Protein of unknown function (DUF1364)